MHCHLEGGGIVFRGRRAMMKINRDGFAVYPEGIIAREKTQYPEPEITMRSLADGTIDHMRNFLDCVRSRKKPNADVDSAVDVRQRRPLRKHGLPESRSPHVARTNMRPATVS